MDLIISPTFEQDGLTKEDLKDSKYWPLYSLSCFSYTIAGIIRLYQGSIIDGINLIIQSVFSYMSDVKTLGVKSHWHLIDRYSAIAVSIYHTYSLPSMLSFVLSGALFYVAFDHLKKSQVLYANRDERFLLEHTKWHLMAPLLALVSSM